MMKKPLVDHPIWCKFNVWPAYFMTQGNLALQQQPGAGSAAVWLGDAN